MTKKNDASSYEGEACPSGAVEPPPMTEHIVITNANTSGYEALPPSEQRPEE